MKKTLPTLVLLFVTLTAFAQIDMLNGLQGHYVFDGDVTDQSPNHYNGSLHGGALLTTDTC